MTESTYNRLFPEIIINQYQGEGEARKRSIMTPNITQISKGSLISLNIDKLTSKDIPIFALQSSYLANVEKLKTKENAYLLNTTTNITGASSLNKKLFVPFIEQINSCLCKATVHLGASKDLPKESTFILGKYYVEDPATREILFVGVVDKSAILSFNTITNYKTVLNKSVIKKNNRDLPLVRFYLSRSVFTQNKYKAIYSYLSPLIDKLAQEEFEIVITSNIRGKFEQLYRFPQFKEIDEMDNFMTQCFTNIIKKVAEDNKTKIKLTQLK